MKKTIVVHSGGMDSSLCLALAIREYEKEQVLSLSFDFDQRHHAELLQAQKICQDWGVEHVVLPITCLKQITSNALLDHSINIVHSEGEAPNTLFVGRNGLMARIAAIHADSLGARSIYLGVMELEEANSGYRDCSRHYMDLMQQILRIDLAQADFEIRTPLIKMTKLQTMQLADKMGLLDYLWENTITCYEGMPRFGCGKCPACKLRNHGYNQYIMSKK